jgi:hypothetical protein
MRLRTSWWGDEPQGGAWDEAQDRLYRERHNLETSVVRAAKLYGMWGRARPTQEGLKKFKYWERQLLARAVKLAAACEGPTRAKPKR